MNLLSKLLFPLTFALLSAGSASIAAAVPASATPVRGGTIVAFVQPEPTVLTSAINTQNPTGIVSVNLFDGLLRYDEKLQPQPSLATSWAIAKDGKSITFHLRHGVKWHDGVDFTSADVKFSMMEVWKKFHPRGRTTFASIDDVETPDAYTAIFKLHQPSLVVMSALNASEAQVLPKHVYEGTDVLKNPANLKPIGTGPFKLKAWTRGQSIELERNPDYWDKPKPYADKLIFRIVPDAGTRSAMLENGEVQYGVYSPVPLADAVRLRNDPQLVLQTRGYEYSAPYLLTEFNLRNPILAKLPVRQAISYAINRQGLIDTVWYGFGKPATGPIPTSLTTFYTAKVAQYPFDPKKAEQLLDEAGYPRKADGVRFTLTQDYMPYGDVWQQTAEYIRQNLKKVGIDMTVRNQDLPTYVKRVYGEYAFDTNTLQMSPFLDPQIGIHRQYWSKASTPGIPWTNAAGYASPKMDALIEASQTEANPAKRAQLFVQIQQLAQTDLPLLPLVELQHFTIYNKRLHGVSVAADGVLSSLKDVWVTPAP